MSFLADSIYSKIISRNHDISRLSNVGHVKKKQRRELMKESNDETHLRIKLINNQNSGTTSKNQTNNVTKYTWYTQCILPTTIQYVCLTI